MEDLQRELAWLKHEVSFIPVSRRRMMQRTVLACFERDAAVACLRKHGIEPPVEIGGNFDDVSLEAMCNLLRKYGYDKRGEV